MFQPSRVGVLVTATYAMLLCTVGSVIYYHIMVENYEDGAQADTRSQYVFYECLSLVGCPLKLLNDREEGKRVQVSRLKGVLLVYHEDPHTNTPHSPPVPPLTSPRTFTLFLLLLLSGVIDGSLYMDVIFAKFLDSGTPLMERLLLRSVGHSVLMSLTLSFYSWFHHQLVEGLGVEPHRATLSFSYWAMFSPLVGRFMQSSAVSVAQAIAFELFATLVEIKTLDGKLLYTYTTSRPSTPYTRVCCRGTRRWQG